MRKIINGKRYDTDTAIFIDEATNLGRGSDSMKDLRYWDAALYKTKSGNFFLAGEGGAMSMFYKPVGGRARSGGSGIIPMSKVEALEWAEKHLHANVVEKHFGDMIQDA